MKNDLPYFSHYYSTHNDPRMQAFLSEYGLEGYGRFWILCEKIAASPNAMLDISSRVIKLTVVRTLELSVEDFDKFIEFLTAPDIKLIKLEKGLITTDQLQEDYSRVDKKRRKDRDDYRNPSTEVQIPIAETQIPASENIQSRVENSIESSSSSTAAGKITTTTIIQKFLEATKKAGFLMDMKVAAYIIKKGLSPDWIDGNFSFPEYVVNEIKTDPKYKDKPPRELKRLYISALTWPDFQEEFPAWRKLKIAEAAKQEKQRRKEAADDEKRRKLDEARAKLPEICGNCGKPFAPESERGNCPSCGWEYAFDEKTLTYRFSEQRSLSDEFKKLREAV